MPLALVENAACMEIASQIAGWLILVIGLLALVIFALAVFTMVQAWYYLGHRKTELERDLGFRDGSACHVVDGKYELNGCYRRGRRGTSVCSRGSLQWRCCARFIAHWSVQAATSSPRIDR